MSEQYKVGTVCIYQNLPDQCAYLNGTECVIISPLKERLARWVDGTCSSALTYRVKDIEGIYVVKPKNLRRKPPKQSDSQWADEAVRKLKKQSSDHVVICKPELIPEETA